MVLRKDVTAVPIIIERGDSPWQRRLPAWHRQIYIANLAY
jgi:hypothetical protein